MTKECKIFFMNESQNSVIADLLLTPPQSKTELFTAFFKMGLQGIGAVLAAVESDLVQRKRWMTKTKFVEECAQAQLMPGPNLVNLCLMIGGRYFGIQGAAAALAGLLCIPLLLAITFASGILFSGVLDSPHAQGALRGVGAVAIGLIAATGLKLSIALHNNAMGLTACVLFALLTFIGVGLLRLPLMWVILGLGTLACSFAYYKLTRAALSKQTES
jgi:chromate transporter